MHPRRSGPPHFSTVIISAACLAVTGCASVSVTPGNIQRPEPSLAYNAIEAEGSLPAEVAVQDFDFSAASVTENRSIFHRAIDLLRRSSAEQRRAAIARQAAAVLARQTVKRLNQTGLTAVRLAPGADIPLASNYLLVSGRLTEVNEGNRFTRVALGLGLGESRLASEVRVFRVVNGERAEVLAFTTEANSGKMPGVAESMGFGLLMLGPLTLIKAGQDALSSGQKIYVSQIDYLAGESGSQVAAYLSQYAAAEHWIAPAKARRPHLAG